MLYLLFYLIWYKQTRSKMPAVRHWQALKCDPGVLTYLMKLLGVSGAQAEVLWTIDDGIFTNLEPVHGLIFFYKHNDDDDETLEPVITDNRIGNIYFAKQVINNVCATQAVISILLNTYNEHIQIGAILNELKVRTMPLNHEMRGIALCNNNDVRKIHNKVAEVTLHGVPAAVPSNDTCNFIGFVPINGRIYELDGLRDGPVDHGEIGANDDWLAAVRPIIMQKFNEFTISEIEFDLVAIVSDREMIYEERIDELLNIKPQTEEEEEYIENNIRNLQMLIDQETLKTAVYSGFMVH